MEQAAEVRWLRGWSTASGREPEGQKDCQHGGIVGFQNNVVDTALEVLGSQHPPSLCCTLPTIRMTYLEFTSDAAFKSMVSMLSLSCQHLWRRVPELPCGTHQKRPRSDIMRLLHENNSRVNPVAFA